MADRLSSKQQAFISAYLANGFNATQAAIEAGYSPDTARQQGSRLLTNVDIKSAVESKLAEQAMSANEVLARLADHARGDMRDFATLTLENLATYPRGNLIKKLKLDIKYDSENKAHQFIDTFELYDAQTALVQLAKVHGLLVDKTALTSPDGKEPFALEVKAIDYRQAIPSPIEE